jgi:hypothetical protein
MVFDFLNIHLAPGVVMSVEGDGVLILTSGASAYLGATVDLKGGTGEAGAVDAGGGGGGGGGFHVFATGDLQFVGSIDVGGGDGGAGAQVAGIPFGGGGGLARGGGSRGGKGSYAFAGGNGGAGGAGNVVRNGRGRIIGNFGGGGGDRCVRLPFFGPIPIPTRGGQGGAGGGGADRGGPGAPQPRPAAKAQARAVLSFDELPSMVGGGGGGGSVVLGSQTGLLTVGGSINTVGGAGVEETGDSGALTLIAAEGSLLVEPGASFNGSDPLAGGAEVTAQFPYAEYLPRGGGGGGGAGGPGQVIYYEEEPCPPGTATDGLIPICIIEEPVQF